MTVAWAGDSPVGDEVRITSGAFCDHFAIGQAAHERVAVLLACWAVELPAAAIEPVGIVPCPLPEAELLFPSMAQLEPPLRPVFVVDAAPKFEPVKANVRA